MKSFICPNENALEKADISIQNGELHEGFGFAVKRCNVSNPECSNDTEKFNEFIQTFQIELYHKIPLANFHDNKIHSVSETVKFSLMGSLEPNKVQMAGFHMRYN